MDQEHERMKFLGTHVPEPVWARVKELAEKSDRPISSYLRKRITQMVSPKRNRRAAGGAR